MNTALYSIWIFACTKMLDSWDDAMLDASVDRLNVKGMSDNFSWIFFLHNKNSAEGSVPPV